MAVSRRKFLLGSMTLSAAWAGWGGMPAWGVAPAPAAQFMQLSSLLVNHRLDAAIGARIAAAAATMYPQAADMTGKIVAIAQASNAHAVEDFFDAIPAGPLQDFAHWIVFAWYTGCASAQKDAQVFSYEGALTYQTTADAVAIPSYGFSGPNLWQRPIVPLSPMPAF
jgi:hypothetical protein